jgi:cytochrome c oxidase assembly protein subunit 15
MTKTNSLSGSIPVGRWILLGVFMLLVQVILGGITRLTGSGLSITEWNVITGIFPPFNKHQWLNEFDKYKQTPQFHLLNSDFGLSDFKFIFFWEWFHRLWARLIALVFLFGFAWLLWKKEIKQPMVRPLITLFLLGAGQGAIGWIMVASGLTGDAIYVAPTRLALHFTFALGLIGYAFWFALQLLVPPEVKIANRPLSKLTWMILSILFCQLLFGALMAGHKAAAVAPTWPTINGDWWPPSLLKESPLQLNLIDNSVTIQFIHRGLAYLLLLLTAIWTFKVFKLTGWPPALNKFRGIPITILFIQLLLGILALLTSPSIVPNHWVLFDWTAQAHQVNAMLFLLSMIYMLYLVTRG